jgi:hypothetical protein
MRVFRIATFFATVLFAMTLAGQDVLNPDFNLPTGGPGGSDNCQACLGTMTSGYAGMSCAAPESGGWGNQNCRIEVIEGMGAYCFVDGYDCCVD